MAPVARLRPAVRAALLFVVGLGTATVGGATACGPSFQAVYESDVRFEHCYALDLGAASPDAMKACWRGWLHGYTYGQSRDRVEYAATRVNALSVDPTLPGVAAASARPHDLVAPLPSSAFSPPPNVADGQDAAVSSQPSSAIAGSTPPRVVAVDASAPAAPSAPDEQCTGACTERWSGCRKGCVDGACDACDGAYRTCVPGCFQDARQTPRSLR